MPSGALNLAATPTPGVLPTAPEPASVVVELWPTDGDSPRSSKHKGRYRYTRHRRSCCNDGRSDDETNERLSPHSAYMAGTSGQDGRRTSIAGTASARWAIHRVTDVGSWLLCKSPTIRRPDQGGAPDKVGPGVVRCTAHQGFDTGASRPWRQQKRAEHHDHRSTQRDVVKQKCARIVSSMGGGPSMVRGNDDESCGSSENFRNGLGADRLPTTDPCDSSGG